MTTMAPSSPRLPSPPPAAEDQLGPPSPSMGAQANRQTTQMEQTTIDANAKRRVHPGTKAEDMAAGPPLVPLNELDSAFQLQEHLAALHYHLTQSGTHAIIRETAEEIATPPPSIDRTLWLYELCRFLVSQCNTLIVGFLFDSPACSASTCPEMRASEWQFLCAVHEQPKSCCAIDYCCHTLDWAANIVTDPKIFPSRFVVSSDAQVKGFAVKNLVNVFRRLHRIFAHAWFQHRSVFWNIEGRTGLYVFFKTVCDMFDLLPSENYKLPPEAEGLDALPSEKEKESEKEDGRKNDDAGAKKQPGADGRPVSIIRPSRQQQQQQQTSQSHEDDTNEHKLGPGLVDGYQSIGRTNTRRHIRASPSTGSAVTTVMETDEEDGAGVTSKMKELSISAPETVEEESEVEVPVIVEQDVMADAAPKKEAGDAAKHQEVPAAEDRGETSGHSAGEDDDSNLGEPGPEIKTQASTEVPESGAKDEDALAASESEKEKAADEDEGDITVVEESSVQEANASTDPQETSVSVEEKPVEAEEAEKEKEQEKPEEKTEQAMPSEQAPSGDTGENATEASEEPAKDA